MKSGKKHRIFWKIAAKRRKFFSRVLKNFEILGNQTQPGNFLVGTSGREFFEAEKKNYRYPDYLKNEKAKQEILILITELKEIQAHCLGTNSFENVSPFKQ